MFFVKFRKAHSTKSFLISLGNLGCFLICFIVFEFMNSLAMLLAYSTVFSRKADTIFWAQNIKISKILLGPTTNLQLFSRICLKGSEHTTVFNFFAILGESVKWRALRALVPSMLACPRALVPSCPNFRRALVPSMLACPRALVPACPNFRRALVPSMLACPRALVPSCPNFRRALVPSMLACPRALVPSCPNFWRALVPSMLAYPRALVPACPNSWRALVPSMLACPRA